MPKTKTNQTLGSTGTPIPSFDELWDKFVKTLPKKSDGANSHKLNEFKNAISFIFLGGVYSSFALSDVLKLLKGEERKIAVPDVILLFKHFTKTFADAGRIALIQNPMNDEDTFQCK